MGKQRTVDETKHPTKRPLAVKSLRSTHGRSSVIIECPCGLDVVTFIWSWAGHGYRYCPMCNRKHEYSLINECNKPVQPTQTIPETIDESTLTPEVKGMVSRLRALQSKGDSMAVNGAPADDLDCILSEMTDLKYDIATALNLPDPDDEDEKYRLYGGRNTAELIEHYFGLNDQVAKDNTEKLI